MSGNLKTTIYIIFRLHSGFLIKQLFNLICKNNVYGRSGVKYMICSDFFLSKIKITKKNIFTINYYNTKLYDCNFHTNHSVHLVQQTYMKIHFSS